MLQTLGTVPVSEGPWLDLHSPLGGTTGHPSASEEAL